MSPDDAACDGETGDCAALRQRVRRLEARVRQLEDAAEPSRAPAGEAASTGSGLPVVKLEPPSERVPTTRRSVSLEPPPASSTSPDETFEPEPIEDEGPVAIAESPSDTDPMSDVPPTRRYRLVGSRLVDLTKGSQASERRRQGNTRGKSNQDPVVQAYDAAMAVYRSGAHADAERSFAELARTHPDHAYADNALYWQGEAAYDQARYADALAAFTDVVERYGGGNKAPDALLKIGLCYGRLGDRANAYDVLTQLIAAYPRSNASRLAKKRLPEYEGAGD